MTSALMNRSADIAGAIALFFSCEVRNSNTRMAYQYDLASFNEWCFANEVGINQLTSFHVSQFLEEKQSSGLAPATLNRLLSTLKRVLGFLSEQKVIQSNPAEPIKPIKSLHEEATPDISVDEMGLLFQSIKTFNDSPKRESIGHRDRALIATMFYTWQRITPTLKLKLKDYGHSSEGKTLTFTAKGNKKQHLLVHPQLAAILDEYIEFNKIEGKNKPLFRGAILRVGNVYKLTENGLKRNRALAIVKRYGEEAAIAHNIQNHSFRVSGASTFIEEGGSLVTAKEQLGHADIATTMKYLRRGKTMRPDDLDRLPSFDI